jgi:hypothetical protein
MPTMGRRVGDFDARRAALPEVESRILLVSRRPFKRLDSLARLRLNVVLRSVDGLGLRRFTSFPRSRSLRQLRRAITHEDSSWEQARLVPSFGLLRTSLKTRLMWAIVAVTARGVP